MSKHILLGSSDLMGYSLTCKGRCYEHKDLIHSFSSSRMDSVHNLLYRDLICYAKCINISHRILNGHVSHMENVPIRNGV